jgi:poly(3-hydroxybutyrate) depolymerase
MIWAMCAAMLAAFAAGASLGAVGAARRNARAMEIMDLALRSLARRIGQLEGRSAR